MAMIVVMGTVATHERGHGRLWRLDAPGVMAQNWFNSLAWQWISRGNLWLEVDALVQDAVEAGVQVAGPFHVAGKFRSV
jgi:hypothetical protein